MVLAFRTLTLTLALALAAPVADTANSADRRPAPTARPAIPAAWRLCRKDSDCTVIPFSCSGRQAVNRRNKARAEQLIYRTQSAAWAACNMPVGAGMTGSCHQDQCEVNLEVSPL